MSGLTKTGSSQQWSWPMKLGVVSVLGLAALLGVAAAWWMTPAQPGLNKGAEVSDVSQQPAAIEPAPAGGRGGAVAATPTPVVVTTLTDAPPLEMDRAAGEGKALAAGQPESKLSADFECALAPNAKKVSDTHFVLDMENKYEYMFLLKLTGVAGKTVRIDCKNVPWKWRALIPVYRYAGDGLAPLPALLPDNYKLSDAKTVQARNGAILPDTTSQAWHFVPEAWMAEGTFSFVKTFEKDAVTVAMKTPFTLEDEKLLCAEAAKCPDAQVIDIGKTPEGRTLHVIKISTGGEEGEKTHPCYVMYAREHADEHDSSWVLAGALRRVLADDAVGKDLRNRLTFFFIPVLDLDAAAKEAHEVILGSFTTQRTSPESIAYAKYFQNWMRAGKPLDIVFNMHNVESAEGGHLAPPLFPPKESPLYKFTAALHTTIRIAEKKNGFVVATDPWKKGVENIRLGDWLSSVYGALYLPYEANSQQAERHLSPDETEALGSTLILSADSFGKSAPARDFFATLAKSRSNYAARWKQYGTGLTERDSFAEEVRVLDLERNAELLNAMLGGDKK